MPPRLLLLLLSCAVLLVACSHGNIKRVSEPAVSLQQVSGAGDGHWTVELRLQNYSTVSMMYDAVDLQVTAGGQLPGTAVSPANRSSASPAMHSVRLAPLGIRASFLNRFAEKRGAHRMKTDIGQGVAAAEGLAFNSLMGLIEWGERFRLEQPTIDTDHQKLFALAERACRISRTPAAINELKDVFDEFSTALKAHFNHEESELEKAGYDKLDEHRAEHAGMLAEHAFIRQRLSNISQRPLYLEEALVILNFMLGVTVGHILHSDAE
jgi:hemerythrin-like metal-binding protein